MFSVDTQTRSQLWTISVQKFEHGPGGTSKRIVFGVGSTDTSWIMLGHHFVLFSSCFGPVDPSQTQDIENRPILRTSHAHSGVAVIEPLLSDFMSKKCLPPPKHFFFSTGIRMVYVLSQYLYQKLVFYPPITRGTPPYFDLGKIEKKF